MTSPYCFCRNSSTRSLGAFARSEPPAPSLVAACTRLVAISGGAEPSKLNGPAVNLSPRSTRLVIALVRLLAYSRAAGLRATYRTQDETTSGERKRAV